MKQSHKIKRQDRTPNRLDQKRNSSRNIIIRTTNALNKDRLLKAVREQGQVTYKADLLELHQTFQQRVWKPEDPGQMLYRP